LENLSYFSQRFKSFLKFIKDSNSESITSSMDGTTRMLLDIAREEVDIRTHGIIHLETHMEMQDAELE
jgi:hypothetical protein